MGNTTGTTVGFATDNGRPALSFNGVATLISALTPILITFFILMLTCMNQNFKGLIFIAGILLSLLFNLLIMRHVGSQTDPKSSSTCSLIELPILGEFNSPSSSILFITFTFTYLFIPMIYNNQMNYPVIILLLALFALDSFMRVKHKCTTPLGVFLGVLVGGLCGILWFTILLFNGADKLLYFNEIGSNAVRCDRPSQQKFRCSVYKNGLLVSQNSA